MKILALTSDRPRHRALLAKLAEVAQVVAFQEVASKPTLSPVKEQYFALVRAAEEKVFGDPQPPLSARVVLEMGSLSASDNPLLKALYDRVIVFGASWIREPLLSRLLEQKAINLHAGLAPEYRGTACNFWADFDGHRECIGATIHYLTSGLDSGDVIERVGWIWQPYESRWINTMSAVQAGQERLAALLSRPRLPEPYSQTAPGMPKLIRYSRAAAFTDEICAAYLERSE